jgi:WD40 repeat protein
MRSVTRLLLSTLWLAALCVPCFSAGPENRPDLIWMRGSTLGENRTLAYSPDGKYFACALYLHPGGVVQLYRAQDGVMVRSITHNGEGAGDAQFSPDGRTLACAFGSGVQLVSVPDGTPGLFIASSFGRLAWSPSGSILARAAGNDIELRRVSDGGLAGTLVGHGAAVRSVSYSRSGAFLASGSDDQTVKVWNATGGAPIWSQPAGGAVFDVAFSPERPESITLASIGPGGFDIWRANDGANVKHSGGVDLSARLAYSPNGAHIALAEQHSGRFFGFGSIQLFSAATLVSERILTNDDFSVAVAYSPDGARIIGNTGVGTTLWRTSDFTSQVVAAFAAAPSGLAVSHDGKLLASRHNNQVRIYNTDDGSLNGVIPLMESGGGPGSWWLGFLPGDTELAVSAIVSWSMGNSGGSEPRIQVYRLADLSRDVEYGVGDLLAMSPDGKLFASRKSNHIVVQHMIDGSPVSSWPIGEGTGAGLVFSPDSRSLAYQGDFNRIQLFDATRGKLVRDFAEPAPGITVLAFSSDGQTLASGHGDGTIRLWNAGNGSFRLLLVGHGDRVTTLRFAPDNVFLLSGSNDNTLDLWLVTDGSLLSHYIEETGADLGKTIDAGFLTGEFAPSDKYFYYGRVDGSVCQARNPFTSIIFPSHGGNTGKVTIKIVTSPDFRTVEGATVTLRAAGLPDITIPVTRVNDFVYTGTFDLRGAPLGQRDVVITAPGVGERTYPAGFTVEAGTVPTVAVTVLGRHQIRPGMPSRYELRLASASNTDLKAVVGELRVSQGTQLKPIQERGDATVAPPTVWRRKSSAGLAVSLAVVPTSSGVTYDVDLNLDTYIAGHTPFLVEGWAFTSLIGTKEILHADHPLSMHLDSMSVTSTTVTATGHTGVGEPSAENTLDAIQSVVESQGYKDFSTLWTVVGDAVSVASKATTDDLHQMFENADFKLKVLDGAKTSIECVADANSATGDKAVAAWLHGAGIIDQSELSNLTNFANMKLASTVDSYLLNLALKDLAPIFGVHLAVFTGVAHDAFDDRLYILWRSGSFNPDWFVGVPQDPKSIARRIRQLYAASKGGSLGYDSLSGEAITAGDPNELAGPTGFGTPRWIGSAQPINFADYFSNVPEASAPAADVVVTNHIDPVLFDTTTVQIGAITFAGQTITPELDKALPVGKRTYSADVDLRPARNLIVHTTCSLDMLTGDLTWRFQSLDPATMMPPEDPLAGFLDPGQEGSVFFSVQPKATLATGAVVTNQASIKFDFNDWMDTNSWFNTIDADKPVSKVNALSSSQNSASFVVSWQGQDVGSGVRDVTVYVSDNGGAWTPWLTNTTQMTGTFTGEYNHTYSFKSQARDNVYNLEDDHLVPEAQTKVVSAIQDVSSQVCVTRGGFRRNATTGRYQQTVTLKNNSTTSITGPVSLVLDSLSSNATLYNKTGVTSATTPTGRPYINVTSGTIAPGASVSVTLELANPTNKAITYSTRVLAGPGSR